ncbi:MAG TPA: GTPase, partial [Isosphaeraceae bacterium]|nr:GTPase [Isosphaeraceae bacterium]
MSGDPMRPKVQAALDRLQARVEAPRTLAPSADDRATLLAAIERARAQLLGPSEPVLTLALAGGTGSGKSTLINALAGTVIAEASEIRPTTRQIQVYHHRDDSLGTLTAELASEATFVAHDRPELRLKMLVDAPDLDSFVVKHRATTRALLKRAGLILYVFSPERYLEERTWSVLREEAEFSACAAVLNKVDRVGSPEELEQISADLRGRFAGLGRGEIRIFRVCARAHVPDAHGARPELAPLVDDMAALRAFIERELRASEIARILRAQRGQVVAHLRAEVDRVAPEGLRDRLAEASEAADARIERAAARLAEGLADALTAVEAELAPLVTLRRHERFWGPFRLWLALTDFAAFGLTSLVRRFLGRPLDDRMSAIERILARGGTCAVDELLRGEAYGLQDLLYARGLPVERWRAITEPVDAPRLLAGIAAEIEAHFDLASARIARWRRGVVAAASWLGGLVPSALVVVGLVAMSRDVVTGHYVGFPLLWHLLAMVVLSFLALQGIVGAAFPGGTRWLGPSLGPRAVRKVLMRTVHGWLDAYRADLELDVSDLRTPLVVLQESVSGGGAIDGA